MAAETSPSEFARAFREVVADASRRLDLLKKELAVACKMRTDRFSPLQSGLRRPTTQEIENIVQGLRLDPAAEAMLRRAAGSRRPEDVAQAAKLAGNVDASERDLAQLGIANDITAVRDAWALSADVEARNRKHEWPDAHRQH